VPCYFERFGHERFGHLTSSITKETLAPEIASIGEDTVAEMIDIASACTDKLRSKFRRIGVYQQ
jgi:hypothetical protein